jgi:signal transduction histidine kinase
MRAAALATLALGWVALIAAALNLWIFTQRRSDRGHLWLSVAALGVALCAVPSALLYGSESAGEAIALRRLLLIGLLVLGIGFVRFSEELLGVRLRWVERVANATIAFLAVASFVPGLVFSGRAIVRPLLGGGHVDAEVTSVGALALLVFLALTARLFVAYLRHGEGPDPSLRRVPGATLLWIVCAFSDLASGAHLVELPLLLPLGYLGFVVAFTATRIRRFVSGMAAAEARATLLERLVEQRTQMLRAQELQLAHGERLAAAGTLAAGLAHEINNPVAFVLANLNHLQALRKEENSGAEIEEVLLETQEGVERLRGIVDELLRLARTGEPGSEPMDLARVVEAVLPMLRHEAGGRVRIEAALSPTRPVLGDPRLLGQVVLNLVQNAIHALHAAERDGCVRVVIEPVGEQIELRVDDDGPGIPEDVLPRIFEPFFTTKTPGSGTGLGLAVTRDLVTRHGGTIAVETGSAGTRFRVSLPAAPALP